MIEIGCDPSLPHLFMPLKDFINNLNMIVMCIFGFKNAHLILMILYHTSYIRIEPSTAFLFFWSHISIWRRNYINIAVLISGGQLTCKLPAPPQPKKERKERGCQLDFWTIYTRGPRQNIGDKRSRTSCIPRRSPIQVLTQLDVA